MERYLIEVISFQALFFVTYWFFFRQNTFFKIHRAYLLICPLVSFVIPYVTLTAFQTVVPENIISVVLPEVIIGTTTTSLDVAPSQTVNLPLILIWVYYVGVILSFALLVYKMSQLFRFLRYRKTAQNIINIPRDKVAFTFLNYICIGDEVDTLSRKHTLAHERIHVKQKHSWDLILFEVLRIVVWFNPLIYIYQKEITRVHEYLADAEAIAQTTKRDYYEKLLNTAFGIDNFSFTNSFYNHSSIKNRITMLQKSKSKKIDLLKYAVIIPMVLGMLFYVSCSDDSKPREIASLENSIEEFQQLLEEDESITEEELALFKSWVEKKQEKHKTESNNYQKIKTEKNSLSKILGVETIRDSVHLSFDTVETVPLFPGCDATSSNEARKTCFNLTINKFIANEFDVLLGKKLALTGIQRIYTLFEIGVDGQIRDVRVRAPHPALKEEALRVINSLPIMAESALNKGKPVSVSYTLPIVYKIEE